MEYKETSLINLLNDEEIRILLDYDGDVPGKLGIKSKNQEKILGIITNSRKSPLRNLQLNSFIRAAKSGKPKDRADLMEQILEMHKEMLPDLIKKFKKCQKNSKDSDNTEISEDFDFPLDKIFDDFEIEDFSPIKDCPKTALAFLFCSLKNGNRFMNIDFFKVVLKLNERILTSEEEEYILEKWNKIQEFKESGKSENSKNSANFDASEISKDSETSDFFESSADCEVADSEFADSEVADCEVADSEFADCEVADSEVADSEVADSEVADSEVADSEVADSEVADSEVANSEVANSKVANRISSKKSSSLKKSSTSETSSTPEDFKALEKQYKAEINHLKKKCSGLEKQLSDNKEALEKSWKRAFEASLAKEKADMEAEHEKMRQELSAKYDQLEIEAKAGHQKILDELVLKESEECKKVAETHAKEIEDLRSEILSLTESRDELVSEKEELAIEKEELSKEIEELSAKKENLQKETENIDAIVDEYFKNMDHQTVSGRINLLMQSEFMTEFAQSLETKILEQMQKKFDEFMESNIDKSANISKSENFSKPATENFERCASSENFSKSESSDDSVKSVISESFVNFSKIPSMRDELVSDDADSGNLYYDKSAFFSIRAQPAIEHKNIYSSPRKSMADSFASPRSAFSEAPKISVYGANGPGKNSVRKYAESLLEFMYDFQNNLDVWFSNPHEISSSVMATVFAEKMMFIDDASGIKTADALSWMIDTVSATVINVHSGNYMLIDILNAVKKATTQVIYITGFITSDDISGNGDFDEFEDSERFKKSILAGLNENKCGKIIFIGCPFSLSAAMSASGNAEYRLPESYLQLGIAINTEDSMKIENRHEIYIGRHKINRFSMPDESSFTNAQNLYKGCFLELENRKIITRNNAMIFSQILSNYLRIARAGRIGFILRNSIEGCINFPLIDKNDERLGDVLKYLGIDF